MIKSVRMQMSGMFKKKEVVLIFFVLMIFISINFFNNIMFNKDIKYITEMPDLVKKLIISDWSSFGYYMMQYYPLLVVIPTACAYLSDRDTRIQTYIQARMSSRNYWYGKMITVFLTTLVLFSLPFLIEILVSSISFSIESSGDPSGFNYLSTIEDEWGYFLSDIFIKNKIIYAIINALIFGMVSGILALFNFSVTTLPGMKYKIFAFFPIYLLFYLISILNTVIKPAYTTSYAAILKMFNSGQKNYPLYCIFLIILIFLSVIFIEIKIRRDEAV